MPWFEVKEAGEDHWDTKVGIDSAKDAAEYHAEAILEVDRFVNGDEIEVVVRDEAGVETSWNITYVLKAEAQPKS